MPSPNAAPSNPLALVREGLIEQLRPAIGALPAPDEPDAEGRWSDLDLNAPTRSNWPGRVFLLRTRALAADPARRDAAIRALRWWHRHDPLNDNWWHNQIGTPRLIAETVLLLGEDIPSDLPALARRALDRSGDFLLSADGLVRKPARWTGANRLWMSINRLYAAVLFHQPDRISGIIADAMAEVRLAAIGEEGMQVDGSFHQHGPLLYNGGYGRTFLTDCGWIVAATLGTCWQPSGAPLRLLADHLLDGTRWMLRGAEINPSCLDRNITRERHEPIDDLAWLADTLAAASDHRRAELTDLASAIRLHAAPGSLNGNRMFYRSDFMAHHADGVHFSVRMHSARTKRGESVNSEGLRSHHLADGLAYLMRTGAEYRDVFPVWDWQRLPGITCALTAEPESPTTIDTPTKATAVGGVSNGRHGACTQHLDNVALSIRKSWFFGPGAMVCLGADLHVHGDTGKVVTTLDQSLVQGPVARDDDAALPPGRHHLAGLRKLRHGPWTFDFPHPTDVVVELGPRAGAWSDIGSGPDKPVSREVFLACIQHDNAHPATSYAYSVRSGPTPPIYEILRNDAQLQAVRWPDAGLIQAVFHLPGELRISHDLILGVDHISCVQLTSDPSGRQTLQAAEIGRQADLLGASLRDATGRVLACATIPPPTGDHRGDSFQVFTANTPSTRD